MKKYLLAAAASLCALTLEANALSCMQPSPANTIKYTQESGKDVLLAQGSINFFIGDTDPQPVSNQPKPGAKEAFGFFNGTLYGPDGKVTVRNLFVKGNVLCGGPWCGAYVPPEDGSDQLFVLTRETLEDGDVHVLPIGPCGENVFMAMPESEIAKLQPSLKGAGQ